MGTAVHEAETKWEPGADTAMPDLAELTGVARVSDPVTQDLDATYFDTAGLALTTAGLTLRRRTGGEDTGWHLKVPVPQGGRNELREPLGGAAEDVVPEPLEQAAQLYTRGRDLGAVAHLQTRRRIVRLCDESGRILAEVCDDVVTAHTELPDAAPATAWREWEVELVDGDENLLRAAGDLLQGAGARPASSQSKLVRALGDRVPDLPARGVEPLGPQSRAADVIGTRLRQQLAELKYRDPLVRGDVPDAVHKMRVAMRRLRSALATFRPLLDRRQTEPLRDELKWLSGALGEARDAEVLHQLLADLIAEEPVELVMGSVSQRVDRELGAAYRLAHRRSLEAMTSERYYRLIDDLDSLVAAPPWTARADRPAAEVLPARVAKEVKRVRRRVHAAEDASDRATQDRLLHEVRKAVRRARYAAEPLIAVHGRDAERFVKATKRVQSILGDHHDAVVAQPALRQLGVQAHLDGDNAFTYGRLHARQQAQMASLEARFHDAWPRAKARKRRNWLP